MRTWWRKNMQKPDGTTDTTRILKMISVWLFSVYAVFFATIMITDGIRYVFGDAVNFANSVKVIAYVGGVVVGSILVPTVDYRMHRGNGYGKKSKQNTPEES